MSGGLDVKTTGKQKIALIGFSILILFVILELGIRSVGVLRGGSFFYPFKIAGHVPRPFVPFRSYGLKLYQTIDGVRYISSRYKEIFPLKKPENTVRIVCFGGSTTENNYAYQKGKVHYPLVLQSILEEKFENTKFEVINVAYSGYATPHSLILLELDVHYWEPDIVILSHNVNDLMASYWPNLTFDYSNKYSDPFFTHPDNQQGIGIIERSRLIGFLKSRYLRFTGRAEFPVIRKSQGNEPPPLAVTIFQRNLRLFVSLAQADGIQVLLGTQPLQTRQDLFDEHTGRKPYNERVLYPLHEEFIQHHHAFNKLIKKVSLETGTLFADNDLALGGKVEFFKDYVHYRVAGVKKLAENYANVLSENETVKQLILSRQTQ